MKMTKRFKVSLITATLAMAAFNASAAMELYNNDGMTFSADGLVNIFYSNSSIEKTDAAGVKTDRDQTRLRTGFLPSYIGFNFAKQLDDVKISMRSSFWVSLSDTDNSRDESPADLGTGSLIDVRQFYGIVSGDFGEVLIGKDFGLFNRANILGDELLLGHGQTSDVYGLVDGNNVSFGNIATGYTYPFPKAQVTYRTPDMGGLKLAVAIMDPNKAGAGSSEDRPRLEAELMYSATLSESSSIKGWVSGVSQTSELAGVDYDSTGVGYGVNFKIAGLSLTASGFQSEGLGSTAGLDTFVDPESVENDGYLVQASYTLDANRFVLTYGQTETEDTSVIVGRDTTTHKNTGVAYFRTIRPGLIAAFEYNNTESETDLTTVAEDNDTFSIGAIVTF